MQERARRLKDVAANPPCPLLLVMVAERLFQGRIGLFGHVAVVQPVKQSRRELFDQHGGAPVEVHGERTLAPLIMFSSLRGDSPGADPSAVRAENRTFDAVKPGAAIITCTPFFRFSMRTVSKNPVIAYFEAE